MTSEFAIAVHALVYLNHKGETVSSEALAENICTNPARVRKVMAKLKKAGLVATKEGVDGGYHFIKAPAEVTAASTRRSTSGWYPPAGSRATGRRPAWWPPAWGTSWTTSIPTSTSSAAAGWGRSPSRTSTGRYSDHTRAEKEGIFVKQYDAIVIGFGKGGKTLAGKLGASGKTVAMIEKSDRMYGGTCINVGCIPSKSLVRSSGISHGHRNADFEKKQAFYAAAIEEKRRLTAMLRKKNFDKLDGNPNVTVFNGMGSFLSPTQVRVVSDRGETLVLEGKQIFINTGSTPVVPPIEGLRENPFVYLSEGLMDLEKLPRRLAIIGGGYIGLEFARI